jgi:carbonic anhydrase/acetyltransferase-like protein (isoleucine patch superfamily)
MAIRPYQNVHPAIATGAFVDDAALVIGDVSIGEDASLWPMVVARGDVHRIVIGARSNIQDGSVLHVTQANRFTPGGHPTIIGSDVTVGHRVILHGCTVEDFALIGMVSTVLDGAIIRSRVLLGAGSLVPPGKELESGYLWLGSPVKKVRPLTEDELAYFEYSAAHYVALKNRHQQG